MFTNYHHSYPFISQNPSLTAKWVLLFSILYIENSLNWSGDTKTTQLHIAKTWESQTRTLMFQA